MSITAEPGGLPEEEEVGHRHLLGALTQFAEKTDALRGHLKMSNGVDLTIREMRMPKYDPAKDSYLFEIVIPTMHDYSMERPCITAFSDAIVDLYKLPFGSVNWDGTRYYTVSIEIPRSVFN